MDLEGPQEDFQGAVMAGMRVLVAALESRVAGSLQACRVGYHGDASRGVTMEVVTPALTPSLSRDPAQAMTRLAWGAMEEMGDDTSSYMTEIVGKLRSPEPQP